MYKPRGCVQFAMTDRSMGASLFRPNSLVQVAVKLAALVQLWWQQQQQQQLGIRRTNFSLRDRFTWTVLLPHESTFSRPPSSSYHDTGIHFVSLQTSHVRSIFARSSWVSMSLWFIFQNLLRYSLICHSIHFCTCLSILFSTGYILTSSLMSSLLMRQRL